MITYVYLFYSTEVSRFKVGISIEPEVRLRYVCSHSPVLIEAKALWAFKNKKAALGAEKLIHRFFIASRVRNEWFDYTNLDTVEAHIGGIAAGCTGLHDSECTMDTNNLRLVSDRRANRREWAY